MAPLKPLGTSILKRGVKAIDGPPETLRNINIEMRGLTIGGPPETSLEHQY